MILVKSKQRFAAHGEVFTPAGMVEAMLGPVKYGTERFDVLTGSSAFSAEGSLFADLGQHEVFALIKTLPSMAVRELAALQGE